MPESDAEALARNFALARELAAFGMRAARVATTRIEDDQAAPDRAERSPSLTLARATTTVCRAIALEHSLRAGESAPRGARGSAPSAAPARPPSTDPRRPLLRDALHKAAAKAEPDRTIRTRTCRAIDERLDTELDDDPDGEIPIGRILLAIARSFNLHIDVAKLPDALLGPPRPPIQLHPDPKPP